MAHSRFHYENVLGPLKEHLGPYVGTTFTHLTFDSYEARNQSWPTANEVVLKIEGALPPP